MAKSVIKKDVFGGPPTLLADLAAEAALAYHLQARSVRRVALAHGEKNNPLAPREAEYLGRVIDALRAFIDNTQNKITIEANLAACSGTHNAPELPMGPGRPPAHDILVTSCARVKTMPVLSIEIKRAVAPKGDIEKDIVRQAKCDAQHSWLLVVGSLADWNKAKPKWNKNNGMLKPNNTKHTFHPEGGRKIMLTRLALRFQSGLRFVTHKSKPDQIPFTGSWVKGADFAAVWEVSCE